MINQKPGLLGLMKKFDLICERSITMTTGAANFSGSANRFGGSEHHLNREFLVPSRAKIAYNEEESLAELIGSESLNVPHDDDYDNDENDDDSDNSDYYDSPGHGADYEDSGEVSSDGYFRGSGGRGRRGGRGNSNRFVKKNRPLNNGLNVEFHYDFCGFLPG